MNRIRFSYFVATVMSIFLFTACSSLTNSEKAVSSARKYAVENLPGLSAKMIHRIKYTPPVIYRNLIFRRTGHSEASKVNLNQICIAWEHAEFERKSIVVTGFSHRDFEGWEPNRVLIKDFTDLEVEDEVGE